jgi:hypothetical protein
MAGEKRTKEKTLQRHTNARYRDRNAQGGGIMLGIGT